ncbi:MAG: WxL domain-containing protein [Lactobacillus sp.]|jgi:hypothetical protein|nr:WxL domain-containing protein [Lactobacillus sp.]
MKRDQGVVRWLLLCAGLLALLASFASEPVRADATGYFNPPSSQTVPSTAGANMITPIAMGGTEQYRVAVNWGSTTSTDATQRYAILRPGQQVVVYTDFNYSGSTVTNPIYYRTAWAQGTTRATLSGTGMTQGSATLTQAEAVTSNSQDYNNIRYRLTAPPVTVPTWCYFQVQVRGGNLVWDRFIGSSIFAMLVLPTNFQLGVTLTPRVVFPGGTVTAQTVAAGLPDNLVPGTTMTATPGAGTWAQNTFTAAALGQATVTTALPLNVPYPATATTPPGTPVGTPTTIPASTLSVSQSAYVGQLDDQTVTAGDDATFALRLPPGLTAQNVRWTLAGATVLGVGDTLKVAAAQTSQNNAPVTATMDVVKDGTLLQAGVVAKATLHVNPAPLHVSVESPLVFSGANVPAGANVTTAHALWQGSAPAGVTWRVDDPSLATIDAKTGVLTANTAGKTGTVTITGSVADGSATIQQSLTVTVGRVAALAPQAAGQAYTLTAPAGTGWLYQWQKKAADSTAWQPLPGATEAAYTATAALADDQARYRVVVTTGAAQTVTSNPVTLTVNPAGLALRQVPSYGFKHGTSGQTAAEMTDPTVAELIAGRYGGGPLDWSDPATIFDRWLLPTAASALAVSDTRGAGETFSLSVALSPFKNGGAFLSTAAGGTATMALNWQDSQGQKQTQQLHDDNVGVPILSQATADPATGRYAINIAPLLALAKAPKAQAGQYQATMTWTLTAGPSGDE